MLTRHFACYARSYLILICKIDIHELVFEVVFQRPHYICKILALSHTPIDPALLQRSDVTGSTAAEMSSTALEDANYHTL